MSQEALGCLGALLRMFGLGRSEPADQKAVAPLDAYRVRDDFLSPAEASFYRVLRLTVGERYLICPKVGLGDLFYVTSAPNSQGARNRIDRKHVDFLLCDPDTLKPLLGLELDDASHKKDRNAARDAVEDAAFKSAGLPLVRVPARAAYEPAQLTALLAQAAGSPAAPVIAPVAEPDVTASTLASPHPQPQAPVCAKCGVPMVLRTAQRGAQSGNRFWGCTNYPKCRQVAASEGG